MEHHLIFCMIAPMNLVRSAPTMQIAVDVTEEMRREAESRGMPVIDYVELLIAKGQEVLQEGAAVTSAIERIRALRSAGQRARE
jgi:hypothetical protein